MPEKGGERSPNNRREEAHDYYRRLVQDAHSEIEWVRKAYKFAAGLVAIVVVVGIAFTYASWRDFKTDARQDIDNYKERLFKDLEQYVNERVAALGGKVEARIEDEFKTENVHALVEEEAKDRVDAIAEPLIRQHTADSIRPTIENAQSQIALLQEEVANAKRTIQDMRGQAQFMETVIAAQTDDAEAFDQLKKWADDASYPRREEAERAWVMVMGWHRNHWALQGPPIPWGEGVEPSSLTLDDFKAMYRSASADVRVSLVHHVWDRKDFSKYQRMAFLAHVLRSHRSLYVREIAGGRFIFGTGGGGTAGRETLGEDGKEVVSPLEVDKILRWWEKNKERLKGQEERKP
jgi:hypothetical protein